jgi:hypothetical protein
VVFFYIVLLIKDLISALLFDAYLHWNTISLRTAARDDQTLVGFRRDILNPGAYCDFIKASISFGFLLICMTVTCS